MDQNLKFRSFKSTLCDTKLSTFPAKNGILIYKVNIAASIANTVCLCVLAI